MWSPYICLISQWFSSSCRCYTTREESDRGLSSQVISWNNMGLAFGARRCGFEPLQCLGALFENWVCLKFLLTTNFGLLLIVCRNPYKTRGVDPGWDGIQTGWLRYRTLVGLRQSLYDVKISTVLLGHSGQGT